MKLAMSVRCCDCRGRCLLLQELFEVDLNVLTDRILYTRDRPILAPRSTRSLRYPIVCESLIVTESRSTFGGGASWSG